MTQPYDDPARLTFPIGMRPAQPIDLDALISQSSVGALVPVPRTVPAIPAPIYVEPIPRYTVKERLYEFATDGRGVIYGMMGVCGIAFVAFAWSFIMWAIGIVTFIIGILPTILTAVGLVILALILAGFRTKGDDSLYLKGCPTRSPGVHKIQLCNRRH
jgi:hypothetical protein